MNCKLNFVVFFAFLVSNGLSMAINSENLNEPAYEADNSGTDEQLALNERERATLRSICLNLAMSDEWLQLDKSTKDTCVFTLLNQLYKNTKKGSSSNSYNHLLAADSDSDRKESKRFFALDVSQNKPLNQHNSPNSNVGFKYGK